MYENMLSSRVVIRAADQTEFFREWGEGGHCGYKYSSGNRVGWARNDSGAGSL